MTTVYDVSLDPWSNVSAARDTLGDDAVAVTPSNTVDFTSYPKALMAITAGNIVVLPLKALDDGAHTITFTGVDVGFVPPFRVRRVLATGTTASVIAIIK